MTTERQIGEIIPASMAFAAGLPTTWLSPDAKPLSTQARNWLRRWLALEITHEKLAELQAGIWRFCHDLHATPATGRLLMIHGENGVGKTHCAKATARWASEVLRGHYYLARINHIVGVSVQQWYWPRLLDLMKGGAWEVLDDLMEATLVVIDDIGSGHDPSRVGVDKLCQVLSLRKGKWTMLTTNVMPEAWENVFDRRIASRFVRDGAEVFDLSGVPDFATRKP